MGQNIYIANNTNSDIHVLVAPNPYWQIADLLIDTTLDCIPGLDILGAAMEVMEGVEFVTTIKNVVDLVKVLKYSGKVIEKAHEIYGGIGEINEARDKANKIFSSFQDSTKNISPGESANVSSTSFLDYCSPSGIGSLLSSEVSYIQLVITKDNLVVDFFANNDLSWIVNNGDVVRSRYGGNIWDQDPQEGSHEFFPSLPMIIWLQPGEGELFYPKGTSWTTRSGYRLIYQNDGNLVFYNNTNEPIWASGTDGKPSDYFVVRGERSPFAYIIEGDYNADSIHGQKVWQSMSAGWERGLIINGKEDYDRERLYFSPCSDGWPHHTNFETYKES